MMIQIYRIKHIPTGLYFEPCGRFIKNCLNIRGKVYSGNSNCIMYGKTDYYSVILKKNFKFYNKFIKTYQYENVNNEKGNYIRCNIPRKEFEKEIIQEIDEL